MLSGYPGLVEGGGVASKMRRPSDKGNDNQDEAYRGYHGQTQQAADALPPVFRNAIPRVDNNAQHVEQAEQHLTGDHSSKPTNRTASSTLLRFDTTALAGNSSSGQPIATQIMMT